MANTSSNIVNINGGPKKKWGTRIHTVVTVAGRVCLAIVIVANFALQPDMRIIQTRIASATTEENYGERYKVAKLSEYLPTSMAPNILAAAMSADIICVSNTILEAYTTYKETNEISPNILRDKEFYERDYKYWDDTILSKLIPSYRDFITDVSGIYDRLDSLLRTADSGEDQHKALEEANKLANAKISETMDRLLNAIMVVHAVTLILHGLAAIGLASIIPTPKLDRMLAGKRANKKNNEEATS